jgi:hypothetical protein
VYVKFNELVSALKILRFCKKKDRDRDGENNRENKQYGFLVKSQQKMKAESG